MEVFFSELGQKNTLSATRVDNLELVDILKLNVKIRYQILIKSQFGTGTFDGVPARRFVRFYDRMNPVF